MSHSTPSSHSGCSTALQSCGDRQDTAAPKEPADTQADTLPLWISQDLLKSGISEKRGLEAGLSAIAPADYEALLGFTLPDMPEGYAIPFIDPVSGGPMKTSDGRPYVRAKLREPVKVGESSAKYLTPRAGGVHAYIPPETASAPRETPLVITEGEKKALCACQHGIPAIGLVGVWGFHSADTGDLLAELAPYVAEGRDVTFVVDSDAACNHDIASAAHRFNTCAALRRCKLKVLVLPPAFETRDGRVLVAKAGLDDYIVAHGAEDARRQLLRARPLEGNVNEIYVEWLSAFAKACSAGNADAVSIAEDILRKGYFDKTLAFARRKIDAEMCRAYPTLMQAVEQTLKSRLDTDFEGVPAPEHGGESLAVGQYVRAPGHDEPVKVDALANEIAWCFLPGSTSVSRPFPRRMVERTVLPRGGADAGVGGGRPREPSATEITNAFLAQEKFRAQGACLIRFLQGRWFLHDGSFYKPCPETDVEGEVMKFLRQHPVFSRYATKSKLADVMTQLRAHDAAGLPSSVRSPSWLGDDKAEPADGWIALKGKLVNLDALAKMINGEDVPDTELVADPTPRLFLTSGMDYAFDPEATCPKFERFLAEVLPDPEIRESAQMMAGLCLVPDTSLNVFFTLYGPAGTGKSTFLHVFSELIGLSNICHVPFASFAEKFSIGQLTENLVNIIGEGNTETAREMGIGAVESVLKDIADGGFVTVERKYCVPYMAAATARCIIATNMLPSFADKSDAIWDRLRVIPFEVRFRGTDRENPGLRKEIVAEEMPGVFNWAVQGLAKLRKLTRFPETVRGMALKNEHRSGCDHEREFLDEVCEPDPTGVMPRQPLYRKYVGWMRDRRYYPLGERRFKENVQQIHPELGEKRTRDAEGRQTHAWTGLKMRQGEVL